MCAPQHTILVVLQGNGTGGAFLFDARDRNGSGRSSEE